MQSSDKEYILSSFVNNLGDATIDNEVREICIQGIYNVISAAETIFENGNGGIIMDQIFKCGTYEDDAEVRVIAL